LTVYNGGRLLNAVVPNLPPATYLKFYDILATALEGKGEVPVRPEAARDTIKLIELVAQSSREGVTLPVKPSRL
jgi:predicted dehydrogenase